MTIRIIDPVKLLCPICYNTKPVSAKFCSDCKKEIEGLQDFSHTLLREGLRKHVKKVMLYNAALHEDLT